MTRAVDLLVLGGGPAGAALAAMAAEAGVRTLLVERASFPRDKVCGEFLAAEGCRVLERIGVLDDLLQAGAAWIDSCRLTHARGLELLFPLPDLGPNGREALGVSRELLDSTLLDRAGRCGASIRPRCEATGPILEAGRVRGARLRPLTSSVTEEVRARIVVAADGRRSVLARTLHPQLGDPDRTGPGSWFGFKLHLERARSLPPGRIQLHVFDGGYAGLCAVDGDRANLGMIATVQALRDCGGSPQRLFTERVLAGNGLGSLTADRRPPGKWRSVGPLRFGARRAAAAGALFVGDAAGTVDPFCGEGMANALCGAELALPYVLRAVERGGLDRNLAAAYERAWRRTFARVTRATRLVGPVLQRPRLARWALVLLGGVGRPLVPHLVAATRTNFTPPAHPASARNRSRPCSRHPPR